MRVLLIEDDLLVAAGVENALAQLGYDECDLTCTEADAVQAASTNIPDLIVADHHLAQGTGADAVRVILECQRIPVVFTTANPEAVRALMPDAVFLTKPFTWSNLAAAIATVSVRSTG